VTLSVLMSGYYRPLRHHRRRRTDTSTVGALGIHRTRPRRMIRWYSVAFTSPDGVTLIGDESRDLDDITAQAAAWNADDPNTGYFVAYLDRPAWTPL
jgi:hypothetical protein